MAQPRAPAARAGMAQGRPPGQDIALALGYGTPSAFIAMFRKQIGFSPERYRRQMRGETVER